MKFSQPILVVAAALASAPFATAYMWSNGRNPYVNPFSLMGPLMRPMIVSPSPGRFLRNDSCQPRGVYSPRYELTDDDVEFKLAVDLPGVKAQDIDVKLEHEGQFLSIAGRRETKGENYEFVSSFSQCFALDPTIDLDHFSATLKDGVLIVSAPKDLKKLEEPFRSIPVTEMSSAVEEKVDPKEAAEHATASSDAIASKPGESSPKAPDEATADDATSGESIDIKKE